MVESPLVEVLISIVGAEVVVVLAIVPASVAVAVVVASSSDEPLLLSLLEPFIVIKTWSVLSSLSPLPGPIKRV